MASILDSFRETFGDKFGFFKLLVFVIPLYFFYDQYSKGAAAFANVFIYICITAFFLFGFLIKTTNYVLNEEDSVMPPLNPLKLAWSAIKGFLAILPATWISVSLANFVLKFVNTIDWVDNTLKTLAWLVVASIVLTSFLMYVKEEKILDAFNMKTLAEKAGDIMLGIVFFVLQLVVINVPTTGVIGYSIYILFGFGPLLNFFIAYAIIFNLIAACHYMAQLQYEILGYDRQDLTMAVPKPE